MEVKCSICFKNIEDKSGYVVIYRTDFDRLLETVEDQERKLMLHENKEKIAKEALKQVKLPPKLPIPSLPKKKELKCKIHKKYKGIRKPKRTDTHPDGCIKCWKVYNAKKKNG